MIGQQILHFISQVAIRSPIDQELKKTQETIPVEAVCKYKGMFYVYNHDPHTIHI